MNEIFKSQLSFLYQCRKSNMFRVTQKLFTKNRLRERENTLPYYNALSIKAYKCKDKKKKKKLEI